MPATPPAPLTKMVPPPPVTPPPVLPEGPVPPPEVPPIIEAPPEAAVPVPPMPAAPVGGRSSGLRPQVTSASRHTDAPIELARTIADERPTISDRDDSAGGREFRSSARWSRVYDIGRCVAGALTPPIAFQSKPVAGRRRSGRGCLAS